MFSTFCTVFSGGVFFMVVKVVPIKHVPDDISNVTQIARECFIFSQYLKQYFLKGHETTESFCQDGRLRLSVSMCLSVYKGLKLGQGTNHQQCQTK